MRLTIIPNDNTVLVDGQARSVDCTSISSLAGIHAVQWDGEDGHEEWQQVKGEYKPNTPLTSIDKYADVMAAWEAAAVTKND
jgi:hypothetical protein